MLKQEDAEVKGNKKQRKINKKHNGSQKQLEAVYATVCLFHIIYKPVIPIANAFPTTSFKKIRDDNGIFRE